VSAVRPDWARLFRIACSLIRQVNSEQLIIDSWSFGGGTAMMLQVGHRESHDVDIFLPDAQLLPFLDPKLHDFEFEIRPSDYGGDGTGFLKLAFVGLGEIFCAALCQFCAVEFLTGFGNWRRNSCNALSKLGFLLNALGMLRNK
jgi:hypothetical protein